MRLVLVLVAYVGAVVAANVLTSLYGLVPVGFGEVATAGTYAAGAALLLRDAVQDAGGRRLVLVAIGGGALVSAVMATPRLAVASGCAFLVAELLDMAVYTPLRVRGWARAVLLSGIVGAVADTFLFLWAAGFPVLDAVPGQLIGKLVWATAVPVAVVVLIRSVRRVVLRATLDAPYP